VLKRIKVLFWLPYFIFISIFIKKHFGATWACAKAQARSGGKIEKTVYKCGHYYYGHLFGNKEERVKKLEHFKNHDCCLCNPKWPRRAAGERLRLRRLSI
jgi:hypothetical protein